MDLVREVERPVDRGVRHHHHELVAPEPADQAVRSADVVEPAGHGAQQLVSCAVAQRVVDHLEAVEVEEQQDDVGPLLDEVLQPLQEGGPVGQAGERVGQGEPGQPPLGLDPHGDVAAGGLHLDAVRPGDRATGGLDPQDPAVVVQGPVPERLRLAGLQQPADEPLRGRTVVDVDEVQRVQRHHLLGRQAEDVEGGRRDVEAPPVAPPSDDDVGAVLGEQPEAALRGDQGLPLQRRRRSRR